MRFKDKVAIVAGATEKSIGGGVARALGSEGAQVVLWDINEKGAKAVEKQIKAKKGGQALGMQVNVLDWRDVIIARDQVLRQFGQIDIMYSTVGGGIFNSLELYTPEFFEDEVEYNLMSTFHCFWSMIEPMKKRKYGKMLAMTSATGGQPGLGGYEVGKAGLESLVKTLAVEMAPNLLNINAIMPGMVDTPLTRGAFAAIPGGDKILEQVLKGMPWGWNTPEEVAPLALYLLSDDAERLTGQVVAMS